MVLLFRHLCIAVIRLSLNQCHHLREQLLDIHPSLGTHLHEAAHQCLRLLISFVHAHRPIMLQVILIPNQHDLSILPSDLPGLLHPAIHRFEGLFAFFVI